MLYFSVMTAVDRLITLSEYLRREELSDAKHDWAAGLPVRRTPTSPTHSLVSANIAAAAGAMLRVKRCRVNNSSLHISFPATDYACYPDAAIICGPLEHDPRDASKMTVTNPTVVIEVLSPSTEGLDRGEKFDRYRSLASFREYVWCANTAPRFRPS